MTINTSINTPALFNKGDLLLGQGGGLRPGILPAGANGLVLTLDNTQPTGAKWAPGGGSGTSLSPYIVGATESNFTTIQAAIDQAVADGASKTSQKNIYVKAGIYNENPILHDGINVIGIEPFAGQDTQSSNSFPNNNFLSVQVTGTVTHADGDSKFYNIWLVPASNSNAFECNAIGGVFQIKGCRIYITGGSGALFNITDSDSINVDDTATAGITMQGKLFNVGANVSGSLFVTRSFLYTDATSTMSSTNSNMNVIFANSQLYFDVDGSNASTLNLAGYDSLLGAVFTQTYLIRQGASTTGNAQFWNCMLYPPAVNPFQVSNASNTFFLFDCFIGSGDSNIIGGGSIIRSNCIEPLYGEQLKSIITGFNGSDLIRQQAGLQTNDTNSNTLATIPIASGEAMTITGKIIGAQDDHTDITGGDFMAVADGTGGIIVGSPYINYQASSTGMFAINFAGGNLTIDVTAPNSNPYNWVCTYSYQKVLTNA